MKIIITLLLLLAVCYVAFSQISKPNQEKTSGFETLTFEAELNKDSYLPFEPFAVRFKVSNRTKVPVDAASPEFLLDSILRVEKPRGEIVEIRRLTTSSGRGMPLPGPAPILNPNQSYEADTTPAIDPNIFVEPGIYRIQFVLYAPGGGTKAIESNIVEITVKNPQGADLDAFEFLRRNGSDAWFGGVFIGELGVSVLREFVDKYADTGYGAYAILSLGKYYLYKNIFEAAQNENELDKAQREFDKIKANENKFIAKEANKSLAEIAKRKAELERAKLPK